MERKRGKLVFNYLASPAVCPIANKAEKIGFKVFAGNRFLSSG
jgi:hypothetical protein